MKNSIANTVKVSVKEANIIINLAKNGGNTEYATFAEKCGISKAALGGAMATLRKTKGIVDRDEEAGTIFLTPFGWDIEAFINPTPVDYKPALGNGGYTLCEGIPHVVEGKDEEIEDATAKIMALLGGADTEQIDAVVEVMEKLTEINEEIEIPVQKKEEIVPEIITEEKPVVGSEETQSNLTINDNMKDTDISKFLSHIDVLEESTDTFKVSKNHDGRKGFRVLSNSFKFSILLSASGKIRITFDRLSDAQIEKFDSDNADFVIDTTKGRVMTTQTPVTMNADEFRTALNEAIVLDIKKRTK